MISLGHFHRHTRFYAGILLGAATGVACVGMDIPLRLTIAGDVFFAVYLILTAAFALTLTADDLRKTANRDDEGMLVIWIVTLGAILLCLGSFVLYLNKAEAADPLHLAFAVLSVPLGWGTLHTVMSFHYANAYYADAQPERRGTQDTRGLDFPGTDEPLVTDFLYYAFTIGMTAQTSDVATRNGDMRKLTLVHSILSYFFNTVIVALAVNVAVSQGH
ncbi:Uncharacterized membrane protein [Faunimonas pinastri]|uniref:Uncharacterized membrane protein n=1 Tax=Faunimonas pinastri TaxID=1855383 RepID=A0A1H9D7F2_9HYPH|nr:DUF1345 domain-containing protein [Faunimonas pinastri]SEQ09422.1 Uncharacterized membrane protein [Faunimonas pinastri]